MEPLIRLDVFQNGSAAASYIETTLQGIILCCTLCCMPFYYEAVTPAAMVIGITITGIGRYRWAIKSGWILTTLGTSMLYLLHDSPVGIPQPRKRLGHGHSVPLHGLRDSSNYHNIRISLSLSLLPCFVLSSPQPRNRRCVGGVTFRTSSNRSCTRLFFSLPRQVRTPVMLWI